jgi:hypothetical protein
MKWKRIRLVKIEKLLQPSKPSTRIRKLQSTMDMADGNFITNQELLGKKNGPEHVDRNDRIVDPNLMRPDYVHKNER